MIEGYILNDYNNDSIGRFKFETLPCVGEHIVVVADTKEKYLVSAVEHWIKTIDNKWGGFEDTDGLGIFVRVRHVAYLD